MGNRPEMIASIFGIALAGGVAVPLSTFSTTAELRVLLERSAVAGVMTQTRLLDTALGDVLAAMVADDGLPFLRWSAVLGEPSWHGLLTDGLPHASAVAARAAAIGPGDPGLIQFSSGTTSTPKGMLHLHRAPTLQFWLQADLFRRTPASRVWAPLPMFWTAGFTTAMGATLAGGGCFVLQEVFDAGDALRLIARERVTEPYTLPHQARALFEHPDWATTDLSSLREVYGKSVFTRHPSVEGDTTWTMPIGYGMSETCAIVVSHRWDTTQDEMKASTGRLLPGVRLRVVDPDTGEALGPGQDGELAVAGPTLMDRYVGHDPRGEPRARRLLPHRRRRLRRRRRRGALDRSPHRDDQDRRRQRVARRARDRPPGLPGGAAGPGRRAPRRAPGRGRHPVRRARRRRRRRRRGAEGVPRRAGRPLQGPAHRGVLRAGRAADHQRRRQGPRRRAHRHGDRPPGRRRPPTPPAAAATGAATDSKEA